MKVIIIEDETHSREKIEDYLLQYDATTDILLSTDNFESVKEDFFIHQADLILSDIQILDGNIFDLLAQTPIVCPFIFITAYDNYFLNAFENHGIGYLLKPYTYEQFKESLDKYKVLKSKISDTNWKDVKQLFHSKEYRERIVVRSNRGIIRIIKVDEVKLFEIEQGVLFIHDKSNNRYMVNETSTLSKIEISLNPKHFFRINKAQIVNINFVLGYQSYGKNRLVVYLESIDSKLMTSINKTMAFKKWINK